MSDSTGFDPKRRLCPDGACTGVIGRDGRCSECGRTAGGSPRAAGADDVPDAAATSDAWPDSNGAGAQDTDGGHDGLNGAAPPGTTTTATATAAGAGFDPNRRLCDDGACVGVVGPNGACTVCGRVAG